VLGGYLGFPEFMGQTIGIDDSNLIERFLQSSIYQHEFKIIEHRFFSHWTLALLSIVAAGLGILTAYYIYMVRPSVLKGLAKSPALNTLYGWSYSKFYIDELYNTLIINPFNHFSSQLGVFDRYGIDGLVNGVSSLVVGIGRRVVSTQNGLLRNYATAMAVGAIIIILIVFI